MDPDNLCGKFSEDFPELVAQQPAQDMVNGKDHDIAAEIVPTRIDGDWWLTRDLPRPEPLLGEVICSSTRALIGGPTGAGKTHLAMAMAGAVSTGRGYLHWLGPAKPRTILYVDGEMARDLILDRIRDLHKRLGRSSLARFHMLCREDFPEMQGLNTPDGRAFLLAKVDEVKPNAVFLDSRMCLLTGDMRDEVPWTDTMRLALELTRRHIAQIWLDHTGHAIDRIYGSKTKEWQMDAVIMLDDVAEKDDADIKVKLRFTKARRRRPETRDDFAPVTITLRHDQWSWEPTEKGTEAKAKGGRAMSAETVTLKQAIANLASAAENIPTVQISGEKEVRAVRWDDLNTYLIYNLWLEETTDYVKKLDCGTSHLTRKGRDRIRNARNTLKVAGICDFNQDFVWLI